MEHIEHGRSARMAYLFWTSRALRSRSFLPSLAPRIFLGDLMDWEDLDRFTLDPEATCLQCADFLAEQIPSDRVPFEH